MQGFAASRANGMHKVDQPPPRSIIVPAHRTQQTKARGQFHSCSKGGWKNSGRYSWPEQSAATTGARKCHRCGREDHDPRNCRFKSYECRNCGEKGHSQAMRRSRGATRYLEPEKRNGREKKETRKRKKVTHVLRN